MVSKGENGMKFAWWKKISSFAFAIAILFGMISGIPLSVRANESEIALVNLFLCKGATNSVIAQERPMPAVS